MATDAHPGLSHGLVSHDGQQLRWGRCCSPVPVPVPVRRQRMSPQQGRCAVQERHTRGGKREPCVCCYTATPCQQVVVRHLDGQMETPAASAT
jgi:hypothetical protein